MRVVASILALLVVAGARADDLAARIAAAAPGDTIEVGPGVYTGPVRVERPLRLVGRGRPVIDGRGAHDIVTIAAEHVEIRGFVIRHSGDDLDHESAAVRVLAGHAIVEDNIIEDALFGIDLKAAPDSVIRGNVVGGKALDIARRGDGLRLWRSDRTLVEGNTFREGRDAILWYSSDVLVRGNVVDRCRYGLHLMYSDRVTLEDNDLTRNSVGVYFMYSNQLALRNNRLLRNRGPSGYGVGLKESGNYRIEGNLIAGNRVGVYFDGSPFAPGGEALLTGNTIAVNDVGLALLPSVGGNTLTGNSFVDNLEQLAVLGRGNASRNAFALKDRGNYWSDYVGYDQDGDGIGDFEHEPAHLVESLLDREPKAKLLLFSPAEQAIEFVGRALPFTRPDPKFRDPAPLMRPPAVASTTHARPASLALAAAVLAAVGGLIVAGARLGPKESTP